MRCPEAEANRRRSGLGELRDPCVRRHVRVPEAVGEHEFAGKDVPTGLRQVGRVDAPYLAVFLTRAGYQAKPQPRLSNEVTKCRRQVRSFGGYPRPTNRR